MADVDPFIHPIPRKLLSDPETRGFFEYLVRWCHDMWRRTGGGDDLIDAGAKRETYPWLDDFSQDINDINMYQFPVDASSTDNNVHQFPVEQSRIFNAVSTSANYTAISFDWINAKKGSKITFPRYPDANDELIIRVGDNTRIRLDGNGKNINGSNVGKLTDEGRAIRFKYFTSENEWFSI